MAWEMTIEGWGESEARERCNSSALNCERVGEDCFTVRGYQLRVALGRSATESSAASKVGGVNIEEALGGFAVSS